MPRGKNQDARYAGLSGRIPKGLRRQLKVKLAMLDLDVNSTLEILVRRFISGDIVITSSDLETVGLQDVPEIKPQPLPGVIKDKRRKPKASPPDKQASPTEVALIVASLDMSQNEAARRVNVSPQTLSRYANGHRTCPPEVLEALKQLQKDSI